MKYLILKLHTKINYTDLKFLIKISNPYNYSFSRHIDINDELVSEISKKSINVLKIYCRSDLTNLD